MIFITVGSSKECGFPRLLRIIDELCAEGIIDGNDILAQIGYTNYLPIHYKTFDMISDDEFKDLIVKSDFIITHAGTGSVISALKTNKKVIIFPRQFKYNEHFDNHQLELAEFCKTENYALVALNKEELVKQLSIINDYVPTPFVSNNVKLNKMIIKFIDD